MSQCSFCQKAIPRPGVCPTCGTTLYTAGGKIIYGSTAQDSCGCETTITDKYLIVRRFGKHEAGGARVGRSFGILGAIVAEAATAGTGPYGYYLLSNIKKGIFPYRTDSLKKKNAVKLINRDGTDFILIFDQPGPIDGTSKVLRTMVDRIRAAIPVMEDGSALTYGSVHCAKPYVTAENFDRVRPGQMATSFGTAYTADSAAETFHQFFSQPNAASARPAANHQPAQPQVQPVSEPGIRCTKCGNVARAGSKFCNECGEKLMPAQKQIRKCLRCGEVLDDGDKFCAFCGYPCK